MSKIEKFEDIIAWQKGRELCNEIYNITNLPNFSKDFGLKDQMRRASVSVISNIAEGFERSSDKDFARFLFMAKGSAAELRSQLYVAKDMKYIDGATFTSLYNITDEISKLLRKFINYLTPTS